MVAGCVWLLLLGSMLQSPEIAFTISQSDLVPEGIAHDPADGSFYVGSTYRRKIVRVGPRGVVSDFVGEQAEGLWGVVGMEVDTRRRLLWAASSHTGAGMPMIDMDAADEGRSGLFAFELEDGALAHRMVLDGSHFLNDVVVTPSGVVLVTDSRTRIVYEAKLETNTLEPFVDLSGVGSPNGITSTYDGSALFVAVGSEVAAVDTEQRSFRSIARPDEHKGVIDGLYFYQGSLIAVQPWVEGGYVVQLVLDRDRTVIERTRPLVAQHPALAQPTTGVIVSGELFFIANSQLQVFRQSWSETLGAPADGSSLVDPHVLKIPLPTP